MPRQCWIYPLGSFLSRRSSGRRTECEMQTVFHSPHTEAAERGVLSYQTSFDQLLLK